ncbi:MAG: leucine-rich repeat domain-containing protein, partial [Clostridia bacterium]|nr:leucine-rich repeat domain-containing protein [Clostridia bacterium]
MKKKFLLSLAIVAMLICVFAISASADTIVPSSSDEFGALTTFDEAIGRTDIGQNKDDGTIARTVLFDGTSYYTVPTTYILSKNQYESGGILLQFSYSAINTKLSKSFNKSSIIRCELPADISLLAGDNQNFNGCGNLVEVKLSQGLRFVGNTTYKAFANCKKLVELDLSMMIIEHVNSTYSLFEYCEKLEKITLPDAYVKDGVPVNYATDYTFNGCKVLETIENYENFFRGSTAISNKFCMDCAKLSEMKLWDGITTIGSRAFQGCASLTEIIIPGSVTVIGTTETVFASCTALKKIVLPKQVSLGDYCFEKCTALEAVWMPSEASTFGAQVFGQ